LFLFAAIMTRHRWGDFTRNYSGNQIACKRRAVVGAQ